MPTTCLVCGTLIASGSRCHEHTIRNGSTRSGRKINQQILERDGWRCQIQGLDCTQHATHVDHIVPLVRGGANTPENMRGSCERCNLQKGAR